MIKQLSHGHNSSISNVSWCSRKERSWCIKIRRLLVRHNLRENVLPRRMSEWLREWPMPWKPKMMATNCNWGLKAWQWQREYGRVSKGNMHHIQISPSSARAAGNLFWQAWKCVGLENILLLHLQKFCDPMCWCEWAFSWTRKFTVVLSMWAH